MKRILSSTLLVLFASTALLGACTPTTAPNNSPDTTSDTISSNTGSEPCALSPAEIKSVIQQDVTETTPQGNWGIASTCNYATSNAPVAVGLSSAASGDISSDRLFEDAQDIADVGDEATWSPTTSTLAVANKSKNKLLRVNMYVGENPEQKLEYAKAVAKLALPKL